MARNMRYPYRAVVGGKEAESRTLALQRGGEDLGAIPLEQVADRMLAEGRFPQDPRANDPEKK